MAEEKYVTSESKRLGFTKSLTFKTLIPMVIIIFLVIGIFGIYLSTTTKSESKEFIIENVLMPEFELLAIEKDNDFANIKKLTEFTAQKIESKIHDSKERASEEIEELFNKYVSKKSDGSYRSSLNEFKGRYQMAAFFNNKSISDIRYKGMFADAFLFFDPFAESLIPFVFTTYFASNNSIWQYGFPDWALTSPADEYFDKYSWFYDADPVHNPNKLHVWTDMYYDALQEQWMISSLMPIYDGEEFLGIVGQDFILQKIVEVTKRGAAKEIGILFFVDNLGNIIAHPDIEHLIGEKAKNDEKLNLKMLPDVALTKVLQKLPDENYYTFTEENNKRIVMSFPLKSVNWKMVYIVDEDKFLEIAEQTNSSYLLYFILFALFVIALVILIFKIKVTSPIKKFTEATNEISKGNLDKKIDVQSKDEIGRLANSFNQMILDLKVSRKKIEGYTGDLENQVKERTKELDLKITELERFNKLTIGRELKLIELKKKNKELEEKFQKK